MAGTRAVVKISAMLPDIEQDCIDAAAHCLFEKKLVEQRAIAQLIKRELDRKYGPTWHVIVGRSFGSYVSHDDQSFVYFFINDCAFLIWRTESQPAKVVSVDAVLAANREKRDAAAAKFAAVFGGYASAVGGGEPIGVGSGDAIVDGGNAPVMEK